MSNSCSPKCEDSVLEQGKSFWNNPCCSNLKLPSKSAVPTHLSRRHSRSIPRSDQVIRVRWFSRGHQLSVPRRLCGPGKTVDWDHLPDAGLQDQEPRELFHAARQPRVLQHQPHLWLLRRMYSTTHSGKRKYNIKLWKTFSDVFNVMPVCALIDEKILCMHGGLSPQLDSLEQILKLVRPLEVPDQGLLCDLLWADPEKGMAGWAENERGVSFIFGGDIVSNFLKEHDIDLICRAHQVVEEGY